MKPRLLSRRAERVWLCLFDSSSAAQESDRIQLERDAHGVWTGDFGELPAGQVYGIRADGPWEPQAGRRFDSAKLLIDPRARSLVGPTGWHPALGADQRGVDSAPHAPRCVVVDSSFAWRGDRPPGVPWERTVIYEAHVGGLTRRHPDLPSEERGTYLGLAHPVVLEHLVHLGVTAVGLLPVQHFFTERHLVEMGLTNYWGYSPLGLFAPHAGYSATGEPVSEFKEMVRRLHEAGLEVILDVVFNHTAEGDANGPTLSLRGLDNELYYRLRPDEPARYIDYTGTGNTLDFGEPDVIALAVDCLRYWVTEMHVDGFRFDLATTLGRGRDGRFRPEAPFFRALAEDPVFASTKWIAEPWDLGPHGYQLGRFPQGWREWNDRFRDAARRFWRGDPDTEAELRLRLAGSPDIFPSSEGRTGASINYVTSHDGFTLEDQVTYERKRNEANGEGNADGHPDDFSHGWGVDGPTDDEAILARRRRAKRGMMASVLLAEGVPMISHGDELGRTQRGNNNAYCQDNETTWLDWRREPDGLADLIPRLLRYRRRPPAQRE